MSNLSKFLSGQSDKWDSKALAASLRMTKKGIPGINWFSTAAGGSKQSILMARRCVESSDVLGGESDDWDVRPLAASLRMTTKAL